MNKLPPDELNAIGVLVRREIEARLLIPVIEALAIRFERQQVLEVVRQTIVEIARQQGRQLAESCPVKDLQAFAGTLENWEKGDAMEIQVLEQNSQCFSFDVHRCRYAEMYQSLGAAELGVLLSCSRDYSLIEGFNPAIHLRRTQTLMEGAKSCDFRYRLEA